MKVQDQGSDESALADLIDGAVAGLVDQATCAQRIACRPMPEQARRRGRLVGYDDGELRYAS